MDRHRLSEQINGVEIGRPVQRRAKILLERADEHLSIPVTDELGDVRWE
jgi:hypothetical protein